MLSYYAFKIPFKIPFRISKQTLATRNGILLVFESEEFTAYGEIAPLMGFSKESIEQVMAVLIENHKTLESAILNHEAEQLISILDNIHQFPSLSFGLDTLMLDLQAKKNGLTLSEALFHKSYPSPNVNGTIGIQDVQKSLHQAETLVSNGINTLKLKVGVDHSKELRIISSIRKEFPLIKIRIDANQAWNLDEAIEYLQSFAPFDIEYCEQPVSEFDIHELRQVKDRVHIPIAADESVRSFHQAKELIEAKACDLLILKPSLFGRLKNCIVTKEWANSHNVDVVVTTAFDTIVGRTITAVLASGLGSEKYAHGLATGKFLNEFGSIPNEIIQGKYTLPTTPGISQFIDLSYFKKII